jgi:hypothetical protein
MRWTSRSSRRPAGDQLLLGGVLGAERIHGVVRRGADHRDEHERRTGSRGRGDEMTIAGIVHRCGRDAAGSGEAMHGRYHGVRAGNGGDEVLGSRTSPSATSTPRSARCSALAGSRVKIRTRSPRSTRRRASCVPTMPVPPLRPPRDRSGPSWHDRHGLRRE